MTYVKTNWQTGDIITAEKLNKIEDGIANARSGESDDVVVINVEVVEKTDDAVIMQIQKPWLEINELIEQKDNEIAVLFKFKGELGDWWPYRYAMPYGVGMEKGNDANYIYIDTLPIDPSAGVSSTITFSKSIPISDTPTKDDFVQSKWVNK